MTETLAAVPAAVAPIQARVPDDPIARLAAALRAAGHGPEFCAWQRQDTETWAAAGELLETWQAAAKTEPWVLPGTCQDCWRDCPAGCRCWCHTNGAASPLTAAVA